ncbi:hypothetical protein V8F20_011486 [Naviculisporaceae sp. PSN 640]
MHNQIARSLATLLPLAAICSGSPLSLGKRADNATGCSATSFGGFQWGISSFVFNSSVVFTTPAHQNSWGFVNFDVTNPAVTAANGGNGDSVAVCSASSNRINDFFYGDLPYTCTSTPGDGRTTTFEFDVASGQLNLNESWVCSDVDPQFPTTFSASGAVKLSLQCDTKSWTNPNWTLGDIYSTRITTCLPVDLTLKPDEMSAIA